MGKIHGLHFPESPNISINLVPDHFRSCLPSFASVVRMHYGWTDQLVDWLTHWLTDTLTHWLTHWHTDWITRSFTDSLIHWLTDSLTDRPVSGRTNQSVYILLNVSFLISSSIQEKKFLTSVDLATMRHVPGRNCRPFVLQERTSKRDIAINEQSSISTL